MFGMENLARSKANTRKRWLRRGSLAEFVLNTCTVPPTHLFPQTAKLAMIGTASLAAMGTSIHEAGQGSWSHSVEPRLKAPQPQLPDTSGSRAHHLLWSHGESEPTA